jgi:hypothetical protein
MGVSMAQPTSANPTGDGAIGTVSARSRALACTALALLAVLVLMILYSVITSLPAVLLA